MDNKKTGYGINDHVGCFLHADWLSHLLLEVSRVDT